MERDAKYAAEQKQHALHEMLLKREVDWTVAEEKLETTMREKETLQSAYDFVKSSYDSEVARRRDGESRIEGLRERKKEALRRSTDKQLTLM